VRAGLSALRDGELTAAESDAIADHLEGCAACAEHQDRLGRSLEALGELQALSPGESIASRVVDRLEVERRGPGLALLFRPAWAARPLMLPSLLEASLVVVAVLTGALALDAPRVPPGPALGSLANPLTVLGDVPMPQVRAGTALADRLLTSVDAGSLFVETVVAADGSVVSVRLIDGDSRDAQPLLDAMMLARFEPTLYQGRRVAVSFYRLISRAEVTTSDHGVSDS
jgi:anti-sigma factor RsiW